MKEARDRGRQTGNEKITYETHEGERLAQDFFIISCEISLDE